MGRKAVDWRQRLALESWSGRKAVEAFALYFELLNFARGDGRRRSEEHDLIGTLHKKVAGTGVKRFLTSYGARFCALGVMGA